jgi:hypothetical protein
MKKKIDIIGAMNAEKSLAREASNEIEKSLEELPDDSPLKNELLKEKSKLKGDLSGLPANHPLLLELAEAKARYENMEAYVNEEEANFLKEQEKIVVRRAKRLEAKKIQAEQRRREDEREENLRVATKRINSSMSETMDSLKRLSDNIAASQEDFQSDQYVLMKLDRLNRLLVATMRGIHQSKLNAGRVVANGR